MDKSRLISQLDILEKVYANKCAFKSKEEEINTFRATTSKILSLIEGPERIYRDVIIKHVGQIDALVNTLQTVNDSQTSYNIIKIINELVGKSNTGKRAQTLVHHGVSKALLQCIYLESKEQYPCEDFLFLLHQVLYKIAAKDKRIGVRARISQCLPVLVSLMRTQVNLVPHNRGSLGSVPISGSLAKNILTLLYVLRLYSRNLINTSRLGRIGAINLLLKIISYCAKNNMNILKVSIETLNLCVRTKNNSARAVNQGAMAMLLELFLDWYRIDSKDKHLHLRKSILGVIKSLINLRSGKKAFLEADGLHTLYGFCDVNKTHNNLESLVTISSLILRKCFPKNRLPLTHYGSVMKCPLPNTTTIHNKARMLLEDYSKTESTPSAPRSTSPIDINPIIPILNCQGDNEKPAYSSKYDGEEFFQDLTTDDSLIIEAKTIPLEKQNNRQRAVNLFRSLDRKLSISRKDSLIQQRHQMYLNRFCNFTTNNSPTNPLSSVAPLPPPPPKSPILRQYDRMASPSPDYVNEKKDKTDQLYVEDMLDNSIIYQPSDDRPMERLKFCYDKFLLERETLNKRLQEFKKKLSIEDSDKSDKSGNSSDNGIGYNEKNSLKAKECLNVPIVTVQLKLSSTERKLNRTTLRRNEIVQPKNLETTEEKSANFICSPANIQKRDSIPLQCSGMYMRSKGGSIPTRNDNINVNSMINDLVDIDNKPIDPLPKLDMIADLGLNSPENVSNDNGPFAESFDSYTDTYIKISSLVTRSLGRFSRISYPDLMENSVKMNQAEPLSDSFLQNLSILINDEMKSKNNNNATKKGSKPPIKKPAIRSTKSNTKSSSIPRPSSAVSNIDALAQNKILDDLRRIIDGEDILDKTVFDLEAIIQSSMNSYNMENSFHTNSDELEVDKSTPLQSPSLQFDSQFECGNLRKAIQIRQYEYDLILNPDVNNNHQIQWFYFRVSAMESGVPYRFNIINCEKPNSQFNFGMQPLLYSVKEAMLGASYWRRYGSEIFYYRNHFARSAATCGGNIGRSYYTFTFVIEFQHSADVCYIAYHYPYTYTRLLTDLHQATQKFKSKAARKFDVDAEGDSKEKFLTHKIEFYSTPEDSILFYIQELCTTILGNPVPVLTISNWLKDGSSPSRQKPYVFLTSRVHPGESNASWVMKGCIDYLLSSNPISEQLRDLYVFKIVPMLNPDGVINGCHRCSMAGQDLNRRWMDPCEVLNPTIFHTKGLMMLLSKYGQTPMVFCDFHGHSRRKNIFMFGCSPLLSWINEDTNNPTFIDQKTEDKSYLLLPHVLNNLSQAFSLESCSFNVEKSKESTARVVVWRQFGVQRSYTMESTYCSFDQGNYKHLHVNVPMLQEMGCQFAEALLHIDESTANHSNAVFPKFIQEYNFNTTSNSRSEKNYQSPIKKVSLTKTSSEIDSSEVLVKKEEEDEDQLSSNDEFEEEEEEEEESESDKDLEFNDEDEVEDSD